MELSSAAPPLPMFRDQCTGQGSSRREDEDPQRARTSPPPAPPPPVRVLGCLALRPGGGGAVGAGGPGQSTGARGAERAQGLRAGEGRGGLGRPFLVEEKIFLPFEVIHKQIVKGYVCNTVLQIRYI